MKRLVIFDIDGTLLFSNRADSRMFAQAFEKSFNLRMLSIDWNDYPHVTDTNILQALFEQNGVPHPPSQEIEEFKDYYVHLLEEGRKHNPEGFREVPGARDTVHQLLAEEQTIVGIATGGFRKPAFVKLNHVGIHTEQLYMSFADGHITREQIIEGVLTQVDAAGIFPEKIIYIGDGIWDVRTTRNLSMPFIGIRPQKEQALLYDEGAHHVIERYPDLQEFTRLLEDAIPPK